MDQFLIFSSQFSMSLLYHHLPSSLWKLMLCLSFYKLLPALFHHSFSPGSCRSSSQSSVFPAYRIDPTISRWDEGLHYHSRAFCWSFRRSFRATDCRRLATFHPSGQREFHSLLLEKNQGSYVHNQNILQTIVGSNKGSAPCTNSRCYSSHLLYHIDWQNADL